MMNRILVIRGGAIGDFILTLPALKALRDAKPKAHIEILGYQHIAVLAENRFYAQAMRSIEYGPLSSFFAKEAPLLAELGSYFASFDLIVTYLYDPDEVFETNLLRCGVKRILRGPAKIVPGSHAAHQLARPLLPLGIEVDDLAAKVFPSAEDCHAAKVFLRGLSHPIVAFHPGSGSETKNWPIGNWIEIGNHLLGSSGFGGSIIIVSGEADETRVRQLESIWGNSRVRFARNLPLPHVAAVLEQTTFVGHDSGISHLAAAAGAECILLFGPTDPAVWAPMNEKVHVVRAPNGHLAEVDPAVVRAALAQALMRIGIRT
jgi:heptosyltransferase-3